MGDGFITIITCKMAARVMIRDIAYIERDSRKLHIVTDKEVYDYYERLESVEPLLDERFYPCLKGCYINLDKVVSMRDQKITFEGGQDIYLGKDNFAKTLQHYKLYLKKL